MYQDRESVEDSFSNRALLANALEGVAANEVEQKSLAEYKGMVATLDRESLKLSKINAEIKDLILLLTYYLLLIDLLGVAHGLHRVLGVLVGADRVCVLLCQHCATYHGLDFGKLGIE